MKQSDPFKPLAKFEKQIADFYGAPYGVAVDCCTHGMELCLRLKQYNDIKVPRQTYISVPFMLKKLNLSFEWKNESWMYYYYITEDIIDGAVWFKKDGYISGTKMCLSFHFKKPINIGRGGMILLDNKEDRDKFSKFGHIAYEVDNIYEECQSLLNKGMKLKLPPKDGFMAFIESPDGISFELLQKGKPLKPKEPWISMKSADKW